MNCVVCKIGETRSGAVTVTLERGETTLVFKHVPAQVCENCGESYIEETTTKELLQLAEAAVANGVHVEVREFVSASAVYTA
jgi:YgiT-type zinc finger domain-containing protein